MTAPLPGAAIHLPEVARFAIPQCLLAVDGSNRCEAVIGPCLSIGCYGSRTDLVPEKRTPRSSII